MSLKETKRLLRTHGITPNKVLGQNFMVEPKLYTKLCSYASLNASDVVLDVGAGFGFLTIFLADKCKAVVAVEKDSQVATVLREQVKGLSNVEVIEGDVLKAALPWFNKVVAIPPYYLSSDLLTWLLERKINCTLLIVQKEFAARLIAPIGSEEYGWLAVLTNKQCEAELLEAVPKDLFYPQPEVDSVVLRLTPWRTKPFEVKDTFLFVQMVRLLFTERNKKLGKAISPFLRGYLKLNKEEAKKLELSLPFRDSRVRKLSPKDFGELANALSD
jgi:16S rRNA (adenine1518-N6/adenine1519-N6)-dimethyltransferase